MQYYYYSLLSFPEHERIVTLCCIHCWLVQFFSISQSFIQHTHVVRGKRRSAHQQCKTCSSSSVHLRRPFNASSTLFPFDTQLYIIQCMRKQFTYYWWRLHCTVQSVPYSIRRVVYVRENCNASEASLPHKRALCGFTASMPKCTHTGRCLETSRDQPLSVAIRLRLFLEISKCCC